MLWKWIGTTILILAFLLYLHDQSRQPQALSNAVQKVITQKLPMKGVLAELYSQRNFRPLWITNSGVNPQAQDLILALAKAKTEGLNPQDYQLNKIERLYQSKVHQNLNENTYLMRQQLADLDMMLSEAFLLYASHLLNGRVNPETIDPNWEIQPTQEDLIQILNRALNGQGIEAALQDLLPKDPGYARLKQVLADYERYREHGIYMAPSDNVSVTKRIIQIKANLERWRWLPQDFGPRFIRVNIADFQLEVVEGERTVMSMPVIVGKDYRETPVFAAQLTEVVINPYWNIPQKIAVQDILPIAKWDPDYLLQKGIHVFESWQPEARELNPYEISWKNLSENNFPYHLRQDPGPQNSLGRIMFLMPNPYAVYLHDTPDKYLFERQVRTYSSGCIRLQKPFYLATYLLHRFGWDLQRLVETARSGQTVSLSVSVPIYILYWTAWVDPAGKIHFIDDVYNRDPVLIDALNAKPQQLNQL